MKKLFMKYVLTGAAGKVTKPLAQQLLAAGHTVTVIGRHEKNLESLVHAGAKAAIGSVEDVTFLKNTFAGADAVFTLVPTNIFVDDLKAQHERIGKNYVEAIMANDIRYVVNLSSIGAHLTHGSGPMSALHYTEQLLNSLKQVHVRTLRAVYFYQNLLTLMGMVRYMNIIGSNFSFASGRFPVAHTDDVAAVAAQELLNLDFAGHSMQYVASDETGTDEIAAVLGNAIGKPDLRWVKFGADQVLQSLQQSGFPANIAEEYMNAFNAMDNGSVTEDYWKNRPEKFGKTKLDNFAKQFAAIFHQQQEAITQ
jgi:uncharacterized protein YbjT (DUF2867 family)